MELLVPTDKMKVSFFSMPAAKNWHTNWNGGPAAGLRMLLASTLRRLDRHIKPPLYNSLIQNTLHIWSLCELIFPTFMCLCVSRSEKWPGELCMFMQEMQPAVGGGKSKKQGSFCLQQLRFYPRVAERCLALQISARSWTDTEGLSWPRSHCPRPLFF